jgi:RanBP-type and C3HC4-type zinc finger-containing protein 1
MYVEDAVSAQGPISLVVAPSITVAELKQQVEQQFEIPATVQKWILDKSLVSEDGVTLSSQGVDRDGARVYLYLVSPEEAAATVAPEAPVAPKAEPVVAQEPVQKGRYWNYEEDRWSVCNSDEDEDEVGGGSKPVAVDTGAPRPSNFQFIPAPTEVAKALEEVKAGEVEGAKEEELGHGEYEWEYYEEEPEKPKEEAKARPNIEALVADHLAAKREVVPPAPEAEGWVCPACTLRNPLERPGCQACTTERPVHLGAGAAEPVPEKKEAGEAKKENNLDAYKQLENIDIIPNAETFECAICFLDIEPGDGVVLRECLHTFCK